MNTQADQTLIRVVRILVQGIGQYVNDGDSDDCAVFRVSINELSDSIVDGIEPEELLVRVGSVLKGLGDLTRHTAKRQSLQTAELKNMVKMLTATVSGISAIGNANVCILGEIEKQVASVSELDDIRIIKSKLSDCLAEIRKEAQRQTSETSETVERLNHELAQARQRSARVPDGEERDPLTGLPLRREAEAALAKWAQAGSHAFAVLLVCDRLHILNQRFGRDVGDEILAAFADMLQKRLKPEDQLFRWGGPTLLALLPSQESIEHVRSEVARTIGVRAEHTIQTRSLDILIPLKVRWTLFPLMSAPRLMYQKLDASAATLTAGSA
jgi:diguanylate cyclase (GGDEF)-like protein